MTAITDQEAIAAWENEGGAYITPEPLWCRQVVVPPCRVVVPPKEEQDMTRTETAERIATEATVFVRKARRDGCSNLITVLALQEAAEVLGIDGSRYSIRTVKAIARRNCELMGETDLLGF